MNRRLLLILLWVAAAGALWAGDLPVMRISVENTDSHTQTKTVRDFARRLQQRTEGVLDIRFFSSSSLVRDSEAVRAMTLGQLEMAVPGTWHLDRLVPEVSVFLLPLFYGRDARDVYDLLDSPAGAELVGYIENDLFVKVPGRWIDLGHTHLFSTDKPITSYDDIRGMRIRVAGGYGNEARINAMGALSTSIAWADFPSRLEQGVVAGVLTSHETVRSGELWNYGIRYAFEDRQYFAQYVPMISRRFWNSLSAEVQEIIIDTWEEGVDESRRAASAAQEFARGVLLQAGVKMTQPSAVELSRMRQHLLSRQDDIARLLGIPHEFIEHVEAELLGETP